jgi:hypothetical protein
MSSTPETPRAQWPGFGLPAVGLWVTVVGVLISLISFLASASLETEERVKLVALGIALPIIVWVAVLVSRLSRFLWQRVRWHDRLLYDIRQLGERLRNEATRTEQLSEQLEQQRQIVESLNSFIMAYLPSLSKFEVTGVTRVVASDPPELILKCDDGRSPHEGEKLLIVDVETGEWLGMFKVVGSVTSGCRACPVVVLNPLWWGKVYELADLRLRIPMGVEAILLRRVEETND